MSSLMEEFEIHRLSEPLFTIGGHHITFTNSTIFMFLAITSSALLMSLAMRPRALVPGRWQMLAEALYNMVSDMVQSAAGEKAKPFFPFIFTIFAFIFFCNLFGLFPHAHAVTSHIIINLGIAAFLFLVIIVTGFVKHGLHFFALFAPAGAPKAMLPFLFIIEFMSFLVRPFSLSIRLFANMLAGHILLQVFAGMTVTMLTAGWVAGIFGVMLPVAANIAITGFEFFVAFLQAYIYTILSAVYLRDALEMH
ncbi:MAG: F0F1 ATP synthase subunit A [Bdellovibrionales bacterium]